MRSHIILLFLFLINFVNAQEEILVNNDWFLTKFIKDGQEVDIPHNEELEQVWAVFKYDYFEAPVVHPFYGGTIFITETVTDTTINYDTYTWEAGPCDFPENCAFENDYVYFFVEDGFPFIDYEIIQIGEFYELKLTATPNDILIYTNNGVLRNNADIQDFKITIYPNPVESLLRIDLGSKNYSEFILKIINLSGKILLKETFNQKEIEINLQKFQTGVYFIVIEQNAKPVYKSRILKN